MKPPIMTVAPLGIIATASSTGNGFHAGNSSRRGRPVLVRRKFEMTATASLDLHQGEPNRIQADLQPASPAQATTPPTDRVRRVWPVEQYDLTLGLTQKTQDAFVVKDGQRSGNCFEREPEIIRDVTAAHRQRDNARGRQPAIHFQQEGGHPFE